MRLIDADYLIYAIEHELWDWGTVDGITATTVLKQTISDIKQTPTVDAVPVIRCKDCKHWLPHTQFGYDADNEEYHNYCNRHLPDDEFYAFRKEAEDYCSWAERKEE